MFSQIKAQTLNVGVVPDPRWWDMPLQKWNRI